MMLAPSPAHDKLSAMSRRTMAVTLLAGSAALAACRAAPPDPGAVASAAMAPRAGVVLVHGFSRQPSHHADQVLALTGVGVAVLTPALPSLLGGDEARDAAVQATAAAAIRLRARIGPATPLTLAGFSAGAAVATEATAQLARDGHAPDGLVLLDPVPWSRTVNAAGSLPSGLPVLALLAPASGCNANGRGAVLVAALPGPARVATIGGASHCDFEAPSDLLCRLACGPDDPGRRSAIITELVRFAIAPRVRGRPLTDRGDRPTLAAAMPGRAAP